LNVITSITNILKIYQAVQKILVGDIERHTQTGDLISLLSFLESRIKIDFFSTIQICVRLWENRGTKNFLKREFLIIIKMGCCDFPQKCGGSLNGRRSPESTLS
jgi:hypothetical protein